MIGKKLDEQLEYIKSCTGFSQSQIFNIAVYEMAEKLKERELKRGEYISISADV